MTILSRSPRVTQFRRRWRWFQLSLSYFSNFLRPDLIRSHWSRNAWIVRSTSFMFLVTKAESILGAPKIKVLYAFVDYVIYFSRWGFLIDEPSDCNLQMSSWIIVRRKICYTNKIGVPNLLILFNTFRSFESRLDSLI